MPSSSDSSQDLSQTAKSVLGQRFYEKIQEENLVEMQRLIDVLQSECGEENEEGRAIVMSLFEELDFFHFKMWVPKPSITLSIRHILMMLESGFKFCKVDHNLEIRVRHGQRIPYYDGHEIPPEQWETQYPCMLHHKAYTALMERCQHWMAQMRKHFSEISGEALTSLKKDLRHRLETVMHDFRIPSSYELSQPPIIRIRQSVFVTDEGKTIDSQLSPFSSQVLTLQQQGEIPSFFNPPSLRELQADQHHFLILLDISASTMKKDIYKYANLASASILQTLREALPGAEAALIPYSDTPQTPLLKCDNFILPGGATAYEKVFDFAQTLLQKRKGYKAVLHISDGLPNSLIQARQSAEGFPLLKIQYSQLIFGDKIKSHDLADQFYAETLDQLEHQRLPTRYEKYVRDFSSVAEAAQGDQAILWMVGRLSESMISLADLSLGRNCLMYASAYESLLEQVDVPIEAKKTSLS